jgi:uncharacterized membrane protein YgaE (UPF0421/DUF939 family)
MAIFIGFIIFFFLFMMLVQEHLELKEKVKKIEENIKD